ncbi:MAG: DUF92 domain-containing protein [Candidatus Velthaea sp.]
MGALTFNFGAWPATEVLLAFFIPSVALSRVGRKRKKLLTDIGKGGPRDAWQVLANGGIATCCIVVAGSTAPSAAWLCAFAGAYAAATADTWGTEIGTLAKRMPVSLFTFRPIAAGLSGGITMPGTLAEVAGAAWIALAAVVALHPQVEFAAIAILAGGILGAAVDSALGATLQELRRCPACERTCETNPHECGTTTFLIRGVSGFGNDAVNGAATLTGGAVAYALALTLG